MLEVYIAVFASGTALFALSFIDSTKNPMLALIAGLFFGLLTYSNFKIDRYEILFNTTSGAPQVVVTSASEPLLSYLTAILAIVGFVQFFYLMWAKAGEVIEDAGRNSSEW